MYNSVGKVEPQSFKEEEHDNIYVPGIFLLILRKNGVVQ